jgi:DHA1 family tetracycline resistance protein-like MFS transporter
MPVLFLIVVIDLIGVGIIIPLLPFYAEYYQATPADVGMVMATYSLTQFIAAPFWGRFSDRFGRKPILLISLLGASLSYLWLGFSDTLWSLFAARAIGGFMAGNISAAFAYVADVTTRENRAKGMGMIGAAFGLGFILGPALGGILAGSDPVNADFQSPALAAAGLSIIAFILTATILKESLSPEIRKKLAAKPAQSRRQQFKKAITSPVVSRLLLISFLATFAFAGLESTFAMWSRRQFGWGPEQNGYLFAFIGILGALIQGGLIGRLTKRFGEGKLIVQGAAALTVGILLIPFSSTLPVLVIAMMIAAYGFSVISPALSSSLSLQASEEEQGSMMGVSRSASTLARVAGPACAGLLFSFFGRDWPYYAGALVMALVVILALGISERITEHSKSDNQ